VFSGFLIELKSVFSWLSWIQWISVLRYATNLISINELRGLTFCLANQTNLCPMTGDDVLTQREIDHSSAWDLWKNLLALVLIAAILFILAFVQFVRIKKTK
jgi:hypothetical protein